MHKVHPPVTPDRSAGIDVGLHLLGGDLPPAAGVVFSVRESATLTTLTR
jgi:hypothetical protein